MSEESTDGGAELHVLRPELSQASILEGLKRGDRESAGHFFDRYHHTIDRLVWVVLGADLDHDDLVQDVLVQLLQDVHRVRDPKALDHWVRSVTLNTVRSALRKRYVRRRFGGTVEDVELALVTQDDNEGRALLRAVYAILDNMSADLRIAFTLRYIEGHTVDVIAETCSCSRSTMKRRIAKAQARFVKLASKHPDLAARLERSPHFKVES